MRQCVMRKNCVHIPKFKVILGGQTSKTAMNSSKCILSDHAHTREHPSVLLIFLFCLLQTHQR